LLPSREWKRRARNEAWYPGESLITGIGQGFTLATPLQLANAAAIVANRGLRVTPRVVQATRDPVTRDTTLLERPAAATVELNNPSHWDLVIQGMVNVVHGERGTARRIGRDTGFEIAGKTGTAQVFGLKQDEEYDAEKVAEHLRDHSLFIAFAPADDPRLAVAVMVENAGSGSAVAAPIARQIFDKHLGNKPAS
jgi:penicillin-binding protein 2